MSKTFSDTFRRVRRLVAVFTVGALVAGGALVAATSAPVLALPDTSQPTEVTVEQTQINTQSSVGLNGPVTTGASGKLASVLAPKIAAGANYTCAVLNTGAVNCWGTNSVGQLGNGTTTRSLVPVAVDTFTGGATAVSITAGGNHTCALLNTGAVNCWGRNFFGQLGNNTTTDSLVPVAVDAFTGVAATAVSVTAGFYHTCAVLNTGAVNCWGSNGFGQLGNGNTTDSLVPVAVAFTGGATAVSITAGFDHTCALLNTGAVNCWGRNDLGPIPFS